MNTRNIILVLMAVVIIMIIAVAAKEVDSPLTTGPQSIKGCYVATLGKDVYTLKIDSINGAAVTGTLSYKNFQKDSSSGPLSGIYENGVLIGDYAFDSEGTHSVRQVVFKKIDNGFIQGFSEASVKDGREYMIDIENIEYDPQLTFLASPCTAKS